MQLITNLQADFPQFIFATAAKPYWSPETQTIFYENVQSPEATWSIMHELGHALLGHRDYQLDIELVRKEAEAWRQAVVLSADYLETPISVSYVQDSLDTYRDWVYRRSICPDCGSVGLQLNPKQYSCLNCSAEWFVSSARFCRAYRHRARLSVVQEQKDPHIP